MHYFICTFLAAVFTFASLVTAETSLPKEIMSNGQWVIADMDGTLIGAPGYKKEPTLQESVAKDAILKWLRAGGQLLILTSCETQRTHDRFTHFIPDDLQSALVERRLLVSTNGGAVISYFDGEQWVEDQVYQDSAVQSHIGVTIEEEKVILQRAVALINQFYQGLRDNSNLIPENLREKYKAIGEIARVKHPYDFTFQEVNTLNSDVVPRIELRRAASGEIVQICVIGIPVDINYDVSRLGLEEFPNLVLGKAGGVTHEINFKGVDKALPIGWLLAGQEGYPELVKEKSMAVGDRPKHNDAPLTTAVGAFVSVCEYDNSSYIPSHVKLRIGHNEKGTKVLLEQLLIRANAFSEANQLEPVITSTLDEVVEECTKLLH